MVDIKLYLSRLVSVQKHLNFIIVTTLLALLLLYYSTSPLTN